MYISYRLISFDSSRREAPGCMSLCRCLSDACQDDMQACTSMEVDIIKFDLSKRLPFRLKPALLQTAVKRGVHLEICYAAAIRDEGLRRSCFANALGKNLLVPSPALLSGRLAPGIMGAS